jgi:hypothetical protein
LIVYGALLLGCLWPENEVVEYNYSHDQTRPYL